MVNMGIAKIMIDGNRTLAKSAIMIIQKKPIISLSCPSHKKQKTNYNFKNLQLVIESLKANIEVLQQVSLLDI